MPKERMLRIHVPKHKSHSKSGKVETVEAHSYMTPDKGAPGRTPEENRWFEAHGELYGWHKGQKAETRHKHLRKAVKAEGPTKVAQKLNGLANVTSDKGTEEAARADERWLHDEYHLGH